MQLAAPASIHSFTRLPQQLTVTTVVWQHCLCSHSGTQQEGVGVVLLRMGSHLLQLVAHLLSLLLKLQVILREHLPVLGSRLLHAVHHATVLLLCLNQLPAQVPYL